MNQFKNEFFEHIFNGQSKSVGEGFYLEVRDKYYPHLTEISQCSAEYLLSEIKRTSTYNLFIKEMNLLVNSLLYKSQVHGEKHISRVCILAYYLACIKEFPLEIIRDVLEIAKYHDIGRINDGKDENHGLRGAILYSQYFRNTSEKSNVYGAIITAHSLRDEVFEKVWLEWTNSMDNINYGKMLLGIIKDADALDRFRLRDCSLRTEFLHNKESLYLVRAAYELYHLYD